MKSVLMSIQPSWCELIASGKKTLEVRKTKPKLKTPFKAYIYCTQGDKSQALLGGNPMRIVTCTNYKSTIPVGCYIANGKVFGEFVCDAIIPISITYSDVNSHIALREFPYTCLTDKEIMDYLGNGKTGYCWHISDLVIYDKPRELSEFKKINRECWYADLGLAKRDCPECQNKDCFITRPPQSWCYVESLPKESEVEGE